MAGYRFTDPSAGLQQVLGGFDAKRLAADKLAQEKIRDDATAQFRRDTIANRQNRLKLQQDAQSRLVAIDDAKAQAAGLDITMPTTTVIPQKAFSKEQQATIMEEATTPSKVLSNSITAKAQLLNNAQTTMSNVPKTIMSEKATPWGDPITINVPNPEWIDAKNMSDKLQLSINKDASTLQGRFDISELAGKAKIKEGIAAKTTKLSVPEYRKQLRADFIKQAGGKDNINKFQKAAIGEQVNKLTSEYKLEVQEPIKEQKRRDALRADTEIKEGIKAKYDKAKAKLPKMPTKEEIAAAKTYIDRIDRELLSDDDTIEYDKALARLRTLDPTLKDIRF